MLKLIIKGTVSDALDAASQREIGLVNPRELTSVGEIIANTPTDNAMKVIAWFAEDVSAPFPAGTLLWYSNERFN